MKRTLISLLTAAVVAGFAISANAATSVVLSSDSPTYLAGGTITLTATVTQNAAETDTTVFGAILYTASKVDVGTQTQFALPPSGWVLGALSCTTTRCVAFSQVHLAPALSVGVTNFVISTVTFTVELDELPGNTITFNWQTTPSTQRLDWFGITNAPGLTVTVIPEPTTAALLGRGLFGLAVAGRRRA
jgi:hypothetical protein